MTSTAILLETMSAADSALDLIGKYEKQKARLDALQFKAMAEFAQCRPPDPGIDAPYDRYAPDELSLVVTWSRRWSHDQMTLAVSLTTRLPMVLAALEDGRLDSYKARKIDEHTASLSDEEAARVADMVLARAEKQTSAQLCQSLKRVVLKVNPGRAEERHREARADRMVQKLDQPDGMADLIARLPADQATAIFNHLDHFARHSRHPGDERTLDQRRAEALVDLVFGPETVRAHIQVTLPYTALIGLDEQPAELAGHGPIPAGVARRIAQDGTWRRILTDPVSGALRDYGRTRYRPPVVLDEFVRARDRVCRFPSCLLPAEVCDVDHAIPYPEGPTNAANLRVLCRTHHKLVHEAKGWRHEFVNGTVEWITPTGRRFFSGPIDLRDP